jgi:predicted RNA-binding Zn-ribbon protein involved in translation (DUF1610 family)
MKKCDDGRVKCNESIWSYISGEPGEFGTIMCTTCDEIYKNVDTTKYHYCPNCGRKMINWKGDNRNII